jgi:hypothetical protein
MFNTDQVLSHAGSCICKAQCWNILYSTINFNSYNYLTSRSSLILWALVPGQLAFILKYHFIHILIPTRVKFAKCTNSIQQSLSCQIIHSASQNIPHSSGNLKVHYVFTTAGPHPIFLRPTLILSPHLHLGLPNQSFLHLIKKMRKPHTNCTPKHTKILVTIITFILGQDNFPITLHFHFQG